MNLAYIADCLGAMKTPVQLVKHFGEVLEKNIKYPLIAQRKYDGVYCLAIRIGQELGLFSRTGKAFYFECLSTFMGGKLTQLPDGVYIGELCSDELTLEELSGYVSPNRKKPWDDVGTHNIGELGYIAFHDYITIDELLDGHSDKPYWDRYDIVRDKLTHTALLTYLVDCKSIGSREQADAYAEDLISKGYEGAVFKDPNADWEAGHKGYRAMKIVRGVSLDLLCTSVVYGKGKRTGQVAALEFEYKGNKFKADLGKGWTDERRKELTNNYEHHSLFEDLNPVGKIWEVKALDISSTGKALRLPKVVRIREDKDIPDS